MKAYVMPKWTDESIFDLVDWEANTIAQKKIRRENRLIILKLEFGLFAAEQILLNLTLT